VSSSRWVLISAYSLYRRRLIFFFFLCLAPTSLENMKRQVPNTSKAMPCHVNMQITGFTTPKHVVLKAGGRGGKKKGKASQGHAQPSPDSCTRIPSDRSGLGFEKQQKTTNHRACLTKRPKNYLPTYLPTAPLCSSLLEVSSLGCDLGTNVGTLRPRVFLGLSRPCPDPDHNPEPCARGIIRPSFPTFLLIEAKTAFRCCCVRQGEGTDRPFSLRTLAG